VASQEQLKCAKEALQTKKIELAGLDSQNDMRAKVIQDVSYLSY
jgi:hypothetical protein